VRKKTKTKKNKKRKKTKTLPTESDHPETEPMVEDSEESGSETESEEDEEDLDTILAKKHPEYKRAAKILEDLKAKFPQFNLNGDKNIWIIKPASMSRGRGILLFNNLVEIIDHTRGKDTQWIA
jgi:tubulin monoglycylase TTLL3/8